MIVITRVRTCAQRGIIRSENGLLVCSHGPLELAQSVSISCYLDALKQGMSIYADNTQEVGASKSILYSFFLARHPVIDVYYGCISELSEEAVKSRRKQVVEDAQSA